MRSWESRPTEVANLFNPAFCGEIIRICVKSYTRESNKPFPYLLVFLILPILLYNDVRQTMKGSYSYLNNWLQKNIEVRINFAQRTRALVPITQESIAFLLQLGLLNLNQDGDLEASKFRKHSTKSQNEFPISDFYEKSDLLGKWFARVGDIRSIYIMWGIQP